jgi:hypothetical protein
VLVNIASRFPHWVERYYSKGIYPVISSFFRRLLGWVPVSVGDILYGVLLLVILRWIWLLIQTRLAPFREHLYKLGAFLSVVFFTFHLFWGLNYYRLPLKDQLGIKSLEYTSEQLLSTTREHIKKINAIHQRIIQDDSLSIKVPYKRRKIYKMASLEYKQLFVDSIDFHFKRKSIKSSMLSTPLTYMGFPGYLNPFTGESQVNRKIPETGFPATTCHEMAHQLGFASESEANYIGYLACVNSDDLYFQYSGELLAVNHLLYSVALYDKELYQETLKELHVGIIKDRQVTHDFWDSYHNPLEPYFKKFYDAFLKANRQKKGIKSYNAMVGYLIKKPNYSTFRKKE